MKKKKICRYAVYTMCAIGLFLIFGAANSVAFAMDMQIIEPWLVGATACRVPGTVGFVICFTKVDEEQLSAYVEYEKALTGNKTVAILANTVNDNVKVWRGVVSDSDFMPKETALRSMDEYVDFYTSKINDKEKVMQNTYKLNELLHRHSIPEKLRSQFVGTCLLALKMD